MLNLKNVKLLKEDKDTFHLHDGKAPFRVAKKGLGKPTLDAIATHFAKGGQVKGYDDGGKVPESMDSVPGQADELQSVLSRPAPGQMYGFEAGSLMNAKPGTEPTQGGQVTPPMAEALAAEKEPVEAAAPPAAPPPGVGGSGQPPTPPVAPQPQAPQMPDLPNRAGQINAAADQVIAGQNDAAKALADAGQAKATIHGALVGSLKRLNDDWQAAKAQNQAQTDNLYQSVLSSKIDPNSVYSHMSTGQHVMAGIAMVLGGLAGGASGKNPGMEAINGAINRDLEAQKENLDTKKSLLTFNMQRGRSLDESMNITRANLWATVQAQADQAADTAQGPEALARAKTLSGVANQERVKALQQNDLLHFNAMAQKLAVGQAATQQITVQAAKARAFSGEADQGDAMVLHESGLGKELIQRRNGKWALAQGGEKSAEEFRNSNKSIDSVAGTLQRFNSYIDSNGLIARNAPAGDVKGLGESLSAELIPKLNELAGLKRLSAEDIKLMEKRIHGLTSLTSASTLKAQLAAIQADLEDRVVANENNYTYMQRKSALTPR